MSTEETRVLHCWADRGEHDQVWHDLYEDGGFTCMEPAGHAGPHVWTPDDKIGVTFLPAGLAMFTNGTDTVIARDTDDAWVVWSEQIGEDRDGYDDEWSWEAIPGNKAIKAWLDPDGTVGCPDDDGAELTCKTVDEWIAHLGRGFAWSTEY